MDFILEYKSFYNVDDIVVVEYWYNGMLTPVKITERRVVKLSYHTILNNPKIQNAPDELIALNKILDKYKLKD